MPVYRRPDGTGWTVDFYYGRPVRRFRKTYHVKTRAEAKQKETRLRASLDRGDFDPELEARNVLVRDLLPAVLTDYAKRGRRTSSHVETRWKLHLAPFFEAYPARSVTGSVLEQYVDARLKEGASNATVNRELALLKRMFQLAKRADPPVVYRVPNFPKLDERDNVRQGFLTPENFDAILAQNPPLWLRALIETYYRTGMRKSEVLKLRVQQVDLLAGLLRLEPGTTKNRQGRNAPITRDLRPLLEMLCAGKAPDAFVFTREDGKPIRDFRKAFHDLMVAARLGQFICRKCDTPIVGEKCACGSLRSEARYVGIILHDTRRSAAKNLRYQGVAEGVIMKIGGWRTRSVFERYAIVDPNDVLQAGRALDAAEDRRKAQQAADSHAGSHGSATEGADAKPGKPN